MSRITAPASKLSRALSSSATSASARTANPLLDSSAHGTGAILMPKYAELLRNRRGSEHSDVSPYILSSTQFSIPRLVALFLFLCCMANVPSHPEEKHDFGNCDSPVQSWASYYMMANPHSHPDA